MIICEPYQSQNMDIPAYKIYSDKNVLIIKDGYYYDQLITLDNDITKIIESEIGIFPPTATKEKIVEVLTDNYENISEATLLQSRNILNNIFKQVNDDTLYDIIFLLPEWNTITTYGKNEKIRYNDTIYCVLMDNLINKIPTDDNINYKIIEKPDRYILNWSETRIPYQQGDKVRIGDYIYTSVVNDNIWSPENFPAAWQLAERSQD